MQTSRWSILFQSCHYSCEELTFWHCWLIRTSVYPVGLTKSDITTWRQVLREVGKFMACLPLCVCPLSTVSLIYSGVQRLSDGSVLVASWCKLHQDTHPDCDHSQKLWPIIQIYNIFNRSSKWKKRSNLDHCTHFNLHNFYLIISNGQVTLKSCRT